MSLLGLFSECMAILHFHNRRVTAACRADRETPPSDLWSLLTLISQAHTHTASAHEAVA